MVGLHLPRLPQTVTLAPPLSPGCLDTVSEAFWGFVGAYFHLLAHLLWIPNWKKPLTSFSLIDSLINLLLMNFDSATATTLSVATLGLV